MKKIFAMFEEQIKTIFGPYYFLLQSKTVKLIFKFDRKIKFIYKWKY